MPTAGWTGYETVLASCRMRSGRRAPTPRSKVEPFSSRPGPRPPILESWRDTHQQTVSGLAYLLAHRAYVGVVEWDGVEYPASHEPLVDRATFERVQELLAARAMRGTRERRHRRYLMGLLACGLWD